LNLPNQSNGIPRSKSKNPLVFASTRYSNRSELLIFLSISDDISGASRLSHSTGLFCEPHFNTHTVLDTQNVSSTVNEKVENAFFVTILSRDNKKLPSEEL